MKSGFVPVVGRPNVGKSTLVNSLVGTKVAITSPRPQTTRTNIRGVFNGDDIQVVFVDTPGLHRPRTALGARLNSVVGASLADADAVVFVIDATGKIGPGDRLIAGRLVATATPVVCVVNKSDLAGPDEVVERLAVAGEWGFAAYVPVSALEGRNLDPIVDELRAMLPEGPQFFPLDMPTDQTEEFLVGEIIREKFLGRLREELPHSLAVVVEEILLQPNGITRVIAKLIVERDSQLGIVVGKGGSLIKEAGSAARVELERRLATRIHLDLRAKVVKDWQEHPGAIERLGL
ncbi:MAG TPA: GTPase Era [Acidimicrobiia bacterium]|nr:GTPase Era [Acidimicrobiia bacterium]